MEGKIILVMLVIVLALTIITIQNQNGLIKDYKQLKIKAVEIDAICNKDCESCMMYNPNVTKGLYARQVLEGYNCVWTKDRNVSEIRRT